MKRNTPNKRGTTELKRNVTDNYAVILKEKSNVNPVFTRKPYEIVKKKEDQGI